MARPKKVAEPAPAPTIDIDATVERLAGLLAPQAEARNALDEAKGNILGSTDRSIRSFVADIAGINDPMDKATCKVVADGIAKKLYTSGVKQRASELLTMLQMRGKVAEILQGVDSNLEKMREIKPDAYLNIRTEVLALAREARKNPATGITALVAARLKKKTTKPEDSVRIGNTLQSLAGEAIFNDTVGDNLLLKPRAAAAFELLLSILEDRDPNPAIVTTTDLPGEDDDNPEETEDPAEIEAEPEPEEAPLAPAEAPPAPDTPQPEEAPQEAPKAQQGVILDMGLDSLLAATEKKTAQG